jgi:hypothetical protein
MTIDRVSGCAWKYAFEQEKAMQTKTGAALDNQ